MLVVIGLICWELFWAYDLKNLFTQPCLQIRVELFLKKIIDFWFTCFLFVVFCLLFFVYLLVWVRSPYRSLLNKKQVNQKKKKIEIIARKPPNILPFYRTSVAPFLDFFVQKVQRCLFLLFCFLHLSKTLALVYYKLFGTFHLEIFFFFFDLLAFYSKEIYKGI